VACTSAKELSEGCHEQIGTLDVGHVAAVGNEGQGAVWETSNRVPCLGLREHWVAGSPHDERWDLKARKLTQQYLALPPEADLSSNHAS